MKAKEEAFHSKAISTFSKTSQVKKTPKVKTKTVLSVPQLKKKVQRVFNKWIRERDKDQPCLACQKRSDNMDASHYVAQGSSGLLRYHPDNVNNTCLSCNRFKHGNLISYRVNLVKKIGEDRVVWLEEHRNDVKKYDRQELEQLLEEYKL